MNTGTTPSGWKRPGSGASTSPTPVRGWTRLPGRQHQGAPPTSFTLVREEGVGSPSEKIKKPHSHQPTLFDLRLVGLSIAPIAGAGEAGAKPEINFG